MRREARPAAALDSDQAESTLPPSLDGTRRLLEDVRASVTRAQEAIADHESELAALILEGVEDTLGRLLGGTRA